jgi:hypothetical protein
MALFELKKTFVFKMSLLAFLPSKSITHTHTEQLSNDLIMCKNEDFASHPPGVLHIAIKLRRYWPSRKGAKL